MASFGHDQEVASSCMFALDMALGLAVRIGLRLRNAAWFKPHPRISLSEVNYRSECKGSCERDAWRGRRITSCLTSTMIPCWKLIERFLPPCIEETVRDIPRSFGVQE